MSLSPAEQKMVARLRKKQRAWLWGKWWCLIGGVVITALDFGTLIYVTKTPSPDLGWIFLFSVAFPTLLIGAMAGAAMMGLAIRDWNGNTTDTLLLKLLDEQANSK